MGYRVRLARALALSVILHLGLLVVPAGNGPPVAMPAEQPGRLTAVLVPAKTVRQTASKDAAVLAPLEARPPRVAERASVPPRGDEGDEPPIVSIPEPPPPPPDIAPWLDAAELDVLPRPRSRPNIEYPPEAERDGIEGSITLQLHIDEQGIVRQAQVLAGTPAGIFDRSALRTVESLRFVPAEKDFRFVRAKVPYALEYRLGPPGRQR